MGNYESYNTPHKIESIKDVKFIECGERTIFCKLKNGEFYCWGYNEYGQLGLGDTTNQNSPVMCLSLSNVDVADIRCGYSHTLVLTSNGDVLSCGSNDFGQLGRRINEYSPSFELIPTLSEIIRIENGWYHSMCIDTNNDFHVFGFNRQFQLGLGDNDCCEDPFKHTLLSNIIDISKGSEHTLVKTSNNEIYAFGDIELTNLGLSEASYTMTPIRVFEGNEDIWYSNINKSKAKSARK